MSGICLGKDNSPNNIEKSLLRKTALNIEQIFVSMEQLLNFSIALLRVKKLQNEMLSTFLVGQVVWVFDATDRIKNYIEDSIDPMKCRDDDLCWKRAKQQFAIKIPPQVKIFIQYKTSISNPQYANQEFDIMLLLTKISPKDFTFYKTYPNYIIANNFLKQYGISINDDVLSIDDIINQTQSYIQQERARQYEASRRQIMNSMLGQRPKRRWRL